MSILCASSTSAPCGLWLPGYTAPTSLAHRGCGQALALADKSAIVGWSENCPFFQSGSSAGKVHQRHLREGCQGCGKKGETGLGNIRNLSQIASFFSDFPPISSTFHTFFLHYPLVTPHFPPLPSIFLHFPTFSPIFPIFLSLCG
jgi:hypothetical protein